MFGTPTFRPSRRLRVVVGALAAATVIACSDGATGPEIASIDLQDLPERLLVNGSAQIVANLRSESGELIDRARLQWNSSDSTTVAVDTAGTVTARRAGGAWVSARSGSLSDSTRVEVEFAVEPGAAWARLRSGTIDRVISFPIAFAEYVQYLGHPDENYSFLLSGTQRGDTLLFVSFPQAFPEGRTPIATITPAAFDTLSVLGRPLAYLVVIFSTSFELTFLAGEVELDVATDVAAPGFREGLVEARLVGQGPSYRLVGESWLPTGRTADLVVDLQPSYQKTFTGWSSGQMTGTPEPAEWDFNIATWYRDRTELRRYQLYVEGFFPPYIRVMTPTTATIDLGPTSDTSRAFLEIAGDEDEYEGVATAGRMEITRYVAPPAADLFGEIQGRVTATGRADDASGGFDFQTTFEFHAPVALLDPTAGGPAGASRRRWPELPARVLPPTLRTIRR